jgi:peptide/nickel transport system permease protein
VLTAWAAVSLTFVALRLTGADPVSNLLSQGLASPQQVEALRHRLGLDLPLVVQYLQFLARLLRGDLGTSIYTSRPVLGIIAEQLPQTAALASCGLLFSLAIGLGLGVYAGWDERGRGGRLAGGLAGLATAMPVALTGILAIWLVGIAGQHTGATEWLTALQGLFLPALVLGVASSGAVARVVQAGLRESLKAPYFLAAIARGLPPGPRLLWHALRPALPPAISLIALEAAFLFAGTVVTETVFSRPGLGRLLISSILQGDYPIAQGLVILAAVVYTASYIVADVLSLLLDPRLRRAA